MIFKNAGFYALCIASALSTLAGCRVRTSAPTSNVKAVQGIALVYSGYVDPSYTTIHFYETDAHGSPVIDTTTSKPKVRHSVSMSTTGSGIEVKLKSNKKSLDTNPNLTYSYYTNSQDWTCNDAEEFVGDARPSDPVTGGDLCYVEITTTGDNGLGVQVIGFPNKQGLSDWVNTSKPVLKDGPAYKLSDATPYLKPGEVNATMDVQGVVDAMNDLKTQFKRNTGEGAKERNTCLKNQRARSWTDISAHYYCHFPLDNNGSNPPYRDCYSRELIAKIATSKNPHKDAFDKCWASTAFFSDPTLGAQRAKAYRYVMWIKQGVMDFNIESENQALNEIYGVADPKNAVERPRRIDDTFPNWLPDQPRYNKVRELQKAMQDKVAAAATPAPATPAPAPLDPNPIPPAPPTPVSIRP